MITNTEKQLLQEALLDCTKQVTNTVIDNQENSQFIKATITKVVDMAKGLYKVKYLNNEIEVISGNVLTTYSIDDVVYIILLDNKADSKPMILGKLDELSKNEKLENNKYIERSPDLISDDNSVYEFSSYSSEYAAHPEWEKIYLIDNWDGKTADTATVNFINEFNANKSNYNIINFGFRVKTSFISQQKGSGNFGLFLKLRFAKKNDLHSYSTVEYHLDTSNMQGDPYNQLIETDQNYYAKINTDEVGDLVEAQLMIGVNEKFNLSNYPESEYAIKNLKDILLKNIKFKFVEEISVDAYAGAHLIISASEGNYFRSGTKDSKILTPIIYINGEQKSSKNFQLNWFKENPMCTNLYSDEIQKRIDKGEDIKYYTVIGGKGWEYIPNASATLTVQNTEQFIQNKYKCAFKYNNSIVSGAIEIRDEDKQITLTLEAPPAVAGELVKITGNITTGKLSPLTSFYLIKKRKGLNEEVIRKTDLGMGYKDIPFTINETMGTSKEYLDVEVYKYDGQSDPRTWKNYLCTSRIVLDPAEIKATGYDFTINGNNQVFYYDSLGLSPFAPGYAGGQDIDNLNIEPISINLYQDGVAVTEGSARDLTEVNWYIPKDSMIKPRFLEEKTGETEDYYIYSFTGLRNNFYYDIADSFKLGSNNKSYIEIIIDKKAKVKKDVNLIFLKDGDSGTNGTEYCIVENRDNSADACIIYQNELGGVSFEGLKDDDEDYLTLKPHVDVYYDLYKDGSLIEIGYDNFKAEFIKIKYKDTNGTYKESSVASFLQIGRAWGSGFRIFIDHDDLQKLKIDDIFNLIKYNEFYMIVKITAKVDNKEIYAYKPIPIMIIKSWSYYKKIRVDDDNSKIRKIGFIYNGFNEVLYNPGGVNPSYPKKKFSTICSENIITSTASEIFVSYNGNLSMGAIDENNEFSVTPATNLNALDNLNCIVHTVYRNPGMDVMYSYCCYPIVMRQNTYPNAAINSWDGLSVDIGEEEGYIYSPQVGAGVKNTDNTFTGMIMGEYFDRRNSEIGLYGFNKSIQTFALKASNGSAIFGNPSENYIKIEPSGNPLIYFKNANAKIYSGEHTRFDDTNNGFYISSDGLSIGQYFSASSDGTIKALKGKISNWTIDDKSLYFTKDGAYSVKSGNFAVFPGGSSSALTVSGVQKAGWTIISGSTFGVTNDGGIYATAGKIGSWSIGTNALSFGDSQTGSGCFISGQAVEGCSLFNNAESNLKLRLRIGDNLGVTEGGKLYCKGAKIEGSVKATSGTIGGWEIGSDTLKAGKILLESSGTLRSANNNWKIDGDGRAYFNNVTVKGSIIGGSSIGAWKVVQDGNGTNLQSTVNGRITGMSTSGKAAFAAGATGSSWSTTAPFWVSHDGEVTASSIEIKSIDGKDFSIIGGFFVEPSGSIVAKSTGNNRLCLYPNGYKNLSDGKTYYVAIRNLYGQIIAGLTA